MELDHVRMQWPVGHGFFHSAELRTGSHRYRYIYDCGGTQWKRCARDYVSELPPDSEIDLLVLSHLHDDHVRGVDFLLAERPVATVMLPYLSEGERLALAVSALKKASAGATFLAFLADPAGWLLEHGAGNVVLVQASNAGPEGNTGNIYHPPMFPDRPIEHREQNTPPTGEDGFTLEVTPFPAHGGAATKASDKAADVQLISHRQSLHLQAAGRPRWLFATYVETPDEARFQTFFNGVRRLLRGTHTARNDVLRRVLQEHSLRGELRALYSRLFPDDFNRTSLCLYSGFGPAPDDVSLYWNARPDGWWFPHSGKRYAWLGTGDARLETPERVGAMATHFGTLLSTVATMSLPHHGSARNYSSELISTVDPTLAVVTASGKSSKHPGKAVVADLVRLHQECHHVTSDPRSIFVEAVKVTDARRNPTR